jgi:hypothetical protein
MLPRHIEKLAVLSIADHINSSLELKLSVKRDVGFQALGSVRLVLGYVWSRFVFFWYQQCTPFARL